MASRIRRLGTLRPIRLVASAAMVVVLAVAAGSWSSARPGAFDEPAASSGALPLSDTFESASAPFTIRATTTTTLTEGVEASAVLPEVRTPAVPPGGSLVATAVPGSAEVYVWSAPDIGAEPAWSLSAETEFWGERHFLVLEDAGEWLRVAVPVRPNGTEGWIPRDAVTLSVSEFEVRVVLSAPTLQVWRDDEMVFEATPAIGNDRAPTPIGRWYIRDVLAWDETSVYGPWVLALSAFSDQIDQINGSDAVVAIHGTNRPDLLGRAVSLGCIRLRNDDISRLAGIVPVGTPVEIVASGG